MTIAQDEVFGPVLTVLTYDTIDEAIAVANDTSYGLSGGPSTWPAAWRPGWSTSTTGT